MLKSMRMYISQTSSVSEATWDWVVFLLAFVMQCESMFTKLWAQCLPEYCSVGVNCLLFSSVKSLSHVQLFATPWTAARQASLSITTPGVYSNSCPLSRWCHPTISSSVVPFSSCHQSFPASGSFPRSQFFASGGQSIAVSTSASVHPMNIQDWFPLGWTGWISLQFKGPSRVFSNTTVQLSHPYMTTGKTIALTRRTFVGFFYYCSKHWVSWRGISLGFRVPSVRWIVFYDVLGGFCSIMTFKIAISLLLFS